MKQSIWMKRGRLALHIAGLILFLEVSSWLILNHVVSPSVVERFDDLFLTEPKEYLMLPHPYLGRVTSRYIAEQKRYLSHIEENRTNKIYVAALGGSTTESGYPAYTEQYLNKRLEESNSSQRAVVFNFGVGGWGSYISLQNYVYVLRYLHPDFVIFHENTNDVYMPRDVFRQSVLYYPQTSPVERALIRNWRFYKLVKLAYLVSYNPIHYVTGTLTEQESPGLRYSEEAGLPPETLYLDEADLPAQARLSSYLNEKGPTAWLGEIFKTDFTGGEHQRAEMPLEFLLTETYESFIKYGRVDGSTVIMTTQYLNYSKYPHSSTELEFIKGVQGVSRDINQIIRTVSRQHNASLVDLDREMIQYDSLLTSDGIHFTKGGIQLKGELIGEAIFDILDERYNLSGQGRQ